MVAGGFRVTWDILYEGDGDERKKQHARRYEYKDLEDTKSVETWA
jgi:hypothetical protein